MSTRITIELSDDLAARLASLPEAADLSAFAASALAEAADAAEAEAARELDPDLVVALREGAADLGAGRLLTLEQTAAAIDAALGARRPQEAREQVA